MVTLRRGGRRGEIWTAVLAAVLSFGVELGRWFKPELQPDFSNVIIASAAAGIAAKLTPAFWSMLEARHSRNQRRRFEVPSVRRLSLQHDAHSPVLGPMI